MSLGDRVRLGVGQDTARSAAGIGVELLDAKQHVVARTTTDCNGLYAFSLVQPAAYSVAVAPEDAGRLGLTCIPRKVRILNDGAAIEGADLLLAHTDKRRNQP